MSQVSSLRRIIPSKLFSIFKKIWLSDIVDTSVSMISFTLNLSLTFSQVSSVNCLIPRLSLDNSSSNFKTLTFIFWFNFKTSAGLFNFCPWYICYVHKPIKTSKVNKSTIISKVFNFSFDYEPSSIDSNSSFLCSFSSFSVIAFLDTTIFPLFIHLRIISSKGLLSSSFVSLIICLVSIWLQEEKLLLT